MPSNHLILCRPLLLLPSIFPSIKVFSNESTVCIRWLKYWGFRFIISPSSEYSGLISKESFIFKELAHAVVGADKSITFRVGQQAEDPRKELMLQLKKPRDHLLAEFLFLLRAGQPLGYWCLQLTRRGPPTSGRAVWFTQSSPSKIFILYQKKKKNKTSQKQPELCLIASGDWSSATFTNKTSHHRPFTQPESTPNSGTERKRDPW